MKILLLIASLMLLAQGCDYEQRTEGALGAGVPLTDQTVARQAPISKITDEQLSDLVKAELGGEFEADKDASTPYYLIGDFDGDGRSDLAVIVKRKKGQQGTRNSDIRYIDVNPYSPKNGTQFNPASKPEERCPGVAILHGIPNPTGARASARYLFFECFSPFRILPKGQKIRRGKGSQGPTPIPKGDSIQLELESGATALVYWTGTTYRGFGQRGGD